MDVSISYILGMRKNDNITNMDGNLATQKCHCFRIGPLEGTSIELVNVS